MKNDCLYSYKGEGERMNAHQVLMGSHVLCTLDTYTYGARQGTGWFLVLKVLFRIMKGNIK